MELGRRAPLHRLEKPGMTAPMTLASLKPQVSQSRQWLRNEDKKLTNNCSAYF
jgi:hypothetical protein